MSEYHAGGGEDTSSKPAHTSPSISRLDADPHGTAPSTDPSNAEPRNEQRINAEDSKPQSQLNPSTPASQFSSHAPSASHSPAPPEHDSGSDSRRYHHHHHHYHHHDSDPNAPTTNDPSAAEAGPSRPRDPTRRKSRKHSLRTRPSHKGPVADPHDPSLIAPGNNGRPFNYTATAASDSGQLTKAYSTQDRSTGEVQPLIAPAGVINGAVSANGAAQRPELIQYGSVYYYPLTRQPTESEAESQGKRMMLVAVVAVVVVLGVLALGSEVREHHGGGKGWHHGSLSG